jgi:two-component system chemotaxis response regulator CheB
VVVVVHTPAENNGFLPSILSRISALPVGFARDQEPLRHGRISVARPDFHLLVTPKPASVARTARGRIPPRDRPLFRTAARAYGPRVIGVVLSGALDDGTYGLSVIKLHGGMAIVQDPREAIIATMPTSAIAHVDVDAVLPAEDVAAMLVHLTHSKPEGAVVMPIRKDPEPQLPDGATDVSTMQDLYGAPSSLTCPDCGGSLWEIVDGRVVRYQCYTGHQFAPDSLQSELRAAVDSALWSAVRVLKEHSELKMRLARRAEAGGLTNVSAGFVDGAREAPATSPSRRRSTNARQRTKTSRARKTPRR